jgi:hypothetical protein
MQFMIFIYFTSLIIFNEKFNLAGILVRPSVADG